MYNSNKFYSIQQPSKNRKVFPECFRSCYMYFTFSGVTLVVLYLGPFLIDDHPKILLPPSFRSRAPHRQVHTIPEDCVLHSAGTAANTTWARRLMVSQEQMVTTTISNHWNMSSQCNRHYHKKKKKKNTNLLLVGMVSNATKWAMVDHSDGFKPIPKK